MATRKTPDSPAPSGRGQARTRLARAAVVHAARTLFAERGYGATTIDAVSELADVPAATVYRLFRSKVGILKALVDVSIAGDDQTIPLADRPHIRALLADPDPTTQLAGFVAVTVDVNTRTAPIYRVLASAASSDPDVAELFAELTRQRQQGQRMIARSLAQAGALRPELRERDAADLIHALMSPELFQLLVHDRRWDVGRYERWLTTLVHDQLLADSGPSQDTRPR